MPPKQLSSAPNIRGDVERHSLNQAFPRQTKSPLRQQHEQFLFPDTGRRLKMHRKGLLLPVFLFPVCLRQPYPVSGHTRAEDGGALLLPFLFPAWPACPMSGVPERRAEPPRCRCANGGAFSSVSFVSQRLSAYELALLDS